MIERAEIEHCFPGGRSSGEPGDADLRDLLRSLQHSFTHNLARYYIIKRLGELMVAICLLSMFLMFRNGVTSISIIRCILDDADLSCVLHAQPTMNLATTVVFLLVIGLVLWFHRWINGSLHFCLETTLDNSTLFVDGQMAIRTKNLTNLIDEIVPRIDDDRLYLKKLNAEQDWPERSKKWTILVYWLAKRLEYIERHAQIEIWLMRRAHYWLQFAARAAYRTIFAFFVLAMLISAVVTLASGNSGTAHISVFVYVAFAAASVAGLWTLHASFHAWNTPLTLISDKLQPLNWKRYRDVHLQVKLADQIVRDQRAILQKDAQLAG